MKWLEEELKDVENKDELIKNIKTNLAKEFVPKTEFNSKIEEVKDLKEQIADRDEQLTSLKDSVKDNEELVDKIKDLETANETAKQEYESKLTNLKKKQLASKLLLDSKAKDVDVNLALFNLDEYELNEEGTELVGFKDTIAKHKEEYGYLYESEQKNYKGFKPIDDSGDDSSGKDSSLGSMFAQARNKSKGDTKSSLWD